MEGSKRFEQKRIIPEKKDELPVIEEVKEAIGKKLGVKIETPVMHAVEGGAEKRDKSVVETILENPKAVRAGAAITVAALRTWAEFWGSAKDMTPGFLKSEAEKKEEGKIKKGGWLKRFADRASDYYEFGGKIEDAVLRGEWDELMKKNKGGRSPESKAA